MGIPGDLQIISHGAAGFCRGGGLGKDYVDPWPGKIAAKITGAVHGSPCKVDTSLLPAYGFDFSANHMLYNGSEDRPGPFSVECCRKLCGIIY